MKRRWCQTARRQATSEESREPWKANRPLASCGTYLSSFSTNSWFVVLGFNSKSLDQIGFLDWVSAFAHAEVPFCCVTRYLWLMPVSSGQRERTAYTRDAAFVRKLRSPDNPRTPPS